jgi:hypothetical protein
MLAAGGALPRPLAEQRGRRRIVRPASARVTWRRRSASPWRVLFMRSGRPTQGEVVARRGIVRIVDRPPERQAYQRLKVA